MVRVTGSDITFAPGKILSNPFFWGGTALIVFAYYTAQGSAQETGQGINNGLTLLAIGGAAALIIVAINKAGK